MGKISNEQIISAVSQSESIMDVIRLLNMNCSSKTYATIKSKIKTLKIDTNHFLLKGSKIQKYYTLEEILIENSPYKGGSHSLKNKLIKNKLLIYKCKVCELSEWLDKPITLQLDHVNGNHSDNRLENLRLLCPNCHTQTETWGGKKNKGNTMYVNLKTDDTDLNYYEHVQETKIIWPSTDILIKMVSESNYTQVGKKLGVSDNTIRKRIRNHPID